MYIAKHMQAQSHKTHVRKPRPNPPKIKHNTTKFLPSTLGNASLLTNIHTAHSKSCCIFFSQTSLELLRVATQCGEDLSWIGRDHLTCSCSACSKLNVQSLQRCIEWNSARCPTLFHTKTHWNKHPIQAFEHHWRQFLEYSPIFCSFSTKVGLFAEIVYDSSLANPYFRLIYLQNY